MPYLHCLPVTDWSRKARRDTSILPAMGASSVCMAVFLLYIRHPRVQLHQTFHRSILVASDAPDEVHLGLARRSV
jgi:hypothetical protein